MKTKSIIADLYTSTDFGDLITVVNEDQIETNNLTFTAETKVSKNRPLGSSALPQSLLLLTFFSSALGIIF